MTQPQASKSKKSGILFWRNALRKKWFRKKKNSKKNFLPMLAAFAKNLLIINSQHSVQKKKIPRIVRICTVVCHRIFIIKRNKHVQ